MNSRNSSPIVPLVITFVWSAFLLVCGSFESEVKAQPPEATSTPVASPTTISLEAQQFIRSGVGVPRKPEANEDWPARRKSVAALFSTRNAELVGKHVESINIVKMSGVDVHVVTPKAYDNRNDPTALLYIHGGGYVGGSSDSTYLVCVPIATRLGLRVYSIDYRLAPEHPYPAALKDCLAVYKEMVSKFDSAQIGVFGESAGGSLLLAMLLQAKQIGLGMPGAVVSMTPWADLAKIGDTYDTLAELDPVLGSYDRLEFMARAYAPDTPKSDPFVSPVYGSYSGGFAPTLIQTGTRDLFLSNCARLYRRMKDDGVRVELSVWEGMWHGFTCIPTTDFREQQAGNDEIAQFLGRELGVHVRK